MAKNIEMSGTNEEAPVPMEKNLGADRLSSTSQSLENK
jgi:hypothetical protein